MRLARIPQRPSRVLIKSAIAGDKDALLFAFLWAETPQGFNYWSRQYGRGLTIRARYRLRAMLRHATAP